MRVEIMALSKNGLWQCGVGGVKRETVPLLQSRKGWMAMRVSSINLPSLLHICLQAFLSKNPVL